MLKRAMGSRVGEKKVGKRTTGLVSKGNKMKAECSLKKLSV